MISYALDYHSQTDGGDAEEFSMARTNHHIFMGTTLDRREKLFAGLNINSWNKAQKKGESDEEKTINMLEMGAKFLYYMTKERRFFVSYVYNLSVKGKSEEAGVSSDTDGTSSLISFGYHLKLGNPSFLLGASLNIHSLTITSRVADSTESEVSDTYASTFPMLEFIGRF